MTFNEILMSIEIGLIYGIVAVGVYLTFRILDFPDLTCDGSFVLGSAVSSILIKDGYNLSLCLFISFIMGALTGIGTGMLSARLKVTELLSGILMSFMLYSINLHVMKGVPNIALIGDDTLFTGKYPFLILVLICLLICSTFSYFLTTDLGLALRSVGQNKRLAFNGGINVKTMTIVGLALGNAIIALGGALFSQHQGFADVSGGVGTVIIGLASVMIGERLLPYRSMWVKLFSCLLGSIVYRILISFALYSDALGLETQDLNLLTGLMVIGIMILPRRRVC